MAQFEEIQIDQGTDVALEIHLVNKDGSVKNLAGYSAAGKLKRTYNSDSADTHDFTTVVTPASGIVNLSLTNTQTDALDAKKYVYDVEISFTDSDGATIIERVLEGNAYITPSVTK